MVLVVHEDSLEYFIAKKRFLDSLPPGYYEAEALRLQRENYREQFRRKYTDWPDGEPPHK